VQKFKLRNLPAFRCIIEKAEALNDLCLFLMIEKMKAVKVSNGILLTVKIFFMTH
jgi:hypothetical protein